jgi:hypothetical protein
MRGKSQVAARWRREQGEPLSIVVTCHFHNLSVMVTGLTWILRLDMLRLITGVIRPGEALSP